MTHLHWPNATSIPSLCGLFVLDAVAVGSVKPGMHVCRNCLRVALRRKIREDRAHAALLTTLRTHSR